MEVYNAQYLNDLGKKIMDQASISENMQKPLIYEASVLLRANCYTDGYFGELTQEEEKIQAVQRQNAPVFIGLLIRQKYVLLSRVNPAYARINDVDVAEIFRRPERFAFVDPLNKL